MDELKSLNKLPADLVRYVFEYLDFVHNTYVIRSGKRFNKLILVQRPLYEVITKINKNKNKKKNKNKNDTICFIT